MTEIMDTRNKPDNMATIVSVTTKLWVVNKQFMISIHTHTNTRYAAEFWRFFVTQHILRKRRGPDSVRDSLIRGLEVLQVEFEVDPTEPKTAVVVLSGVKALREVIRHKQAGQIKKLIAGPNVVLHPSDANSVMLDKALDVVLIPSQWVSDFWVNEAPELVDKLRVWPSGVAVSKASNRTGKPIIYDKLGDASLLEQIQQRLPLPAQVFTYGSFKHQDYLSALSEAPYLIYLSKSESQGLALQEAWARDIPTLVNKSTHWEADGYSWDAPQINCPYLTPELGAIFDDPEELPILIKQVSSLHPKEYCDEHLSDRASAQKLLEII